MNGAKTGMATIHKAMLLILTVLQMARNVCSAAVPGATPPSTAGPLTAAGAGQAKATVLWASGLPCSQFSKGEPRRPAAGGGGNSAIAERAGRKKKSAAGSA